MFRIAYTSTVAKTLRESDLEALLGHAQKHNREEMITGFLTYDGTSFFQYLEGPQNAVERLVARIRADERHHDVRTLFALNMPPGTARALPEWNMHYRKLSALAPYIQDRLARLMARGSVDARGEDTNACLELILRMRFPGTG